MADEPVFIIYSETYATYSEALKGKRFDTGSEEYRRVIAVISAWDAAIQEHGDRVEKVVMYSKEGVLTFDAYTKAEWDGHVAADDEE